MGHLSDLPFELLQRIASFLNCSSALNLARVSCKLHNACNHRMVFRDIALYSLAHDFVDSPSETFLWPEGFNILKNASITDTVRVAFAVELAVKRTGRKRDSSSSTQDWSRTFEGAVHPDIDEWLPQLLAWHHPSCKYLLDTSLLPVHLELGKRLEARGQINLQQTRASFTNVGFCLAYFALQNISQMGDESDDIYTPFEVEQSIAKMSTEYMFSMCWGLKPPDVGRNSHSLERFDLAQGSTCVVPFLYSILGSGLVGRMPFPIPSKIPFSSFMDIPWVFRGNAGAFSRCHVQKMTEPEFLTGTWMGYYTDQRLVNHRHFAIVGPPMNDIDIVAEASGENRNSLDPKGYIHCSNSSGFDSHGPFTVCGSFYHDGRVEFVKSYTLHAWEWDYTGIVTPFGIVGRWSDLEGIFGGHFWIWKKDWCETQST